MDRRDFISHTSALGGVLAMPGAPGIADFFTNIDEPWFEKSMRWAQLAFVENDPGRFDPDFWLDYFKRIHADGALLSAGGIVAFYPTKIPLHHRSDWLADSNPLGYLIEGCRKMNMTIILRTDPHAVRQEVYDAHPEYISVLANGEKRRHWANKDLWVTCAYGPYNFEFMTKVNIEIMQMFKPEGIFSNRWSGHGVCYCESCKTNFRNAKGLELPKTSERLDPVYQKWSEWRVERLRELWFLWDKEIRKIKSTSRYIPNGFPDKLETGKYSDFFFADQQARSSTIPSWSNALGAKELRAGLGMKPLVGIFSVGEEGEFRWKDSVQNDAEIRIWVAEGVANGMKPCFVKFGGQIDDKRWMNAVEKMYQSYYKSESYLRNTAPMARIGVVYSEQTNMKYGGQPWQQKSNDHLLGMYHSLVEDNMPFEMVNDKLMDEGRLKPFKLLILPNIAALSDEQCNQLRTFVKNGGSLLATFETSLYNEEGKQRSDFGLSDLLGVKYEGSVEGPMRNSYLRIRKDASGQYHPVVKGLEDANKIINTIYRVKVSTGLKLPSPITLVPTFPDLPMEDVYPRLPDTDDRQLILREFGKGRVAYFPGDIDRSFWQIMSVDYSKLLRNTIRWTLNEAPIVDVDVKGLLDVAVWRQKNSMTVHLVNLTNPMMLKGPFRDIYPVAAKLGINIPAGSRVTGVKLLMSGVTPKFENKNGKVILDVPAISDHEIVALDLA